MRFSGEWQAFLTAFRNSDTDLPTRHQRIRRASNDPNWMYWPSLHPPERVRPLAANEMLCGFMPICRISHRGPRSIDQAYRDGWTGHCEAVRPTVLHRSGYRLEDIGGDGRTRPAREYKPVLHQQSSDPVAGAGLARVSPCPLDDGLEPKPTVAPGEASYRTRCVRTRGISRLA